MDEAGVPGRVLVLRVDPGSPSARARLPPIGHVDRPTAAEVAGAATSTSTTGLSAPAAAPEGTGWPTLVVARKFLIRTFGCQMNEHDSERLAGLLVADGLEPTDDVDEAPTSSCSTPAASGRTPTTSSTATSAI